MFTEDELQESSALEVQDQEVRVKPTPKKVKMYVNPEAFKEDISVNIIDLDNAFITQASMFAHYGMMSAKASEQMDNFKMTLDAVEAKLNTVHREALLKATGKVTEAMVTNAVLTDKNYLLARKNYIEAKGVYEMSKVPTEAYRHRRDMLIQLGATAREERKGEMFIKSKEVDDVSQRDRVRKVVSR